MKSTIEQLLSHRSVRSFTEEPISPQTLHAILEAGMRASTSSNMHAYSVIHIAEPDLKTQMAKLCGDQKQIHQSAVFLAFCADLHRLGLACAQHAAPPIEANAEALIVATVDTALLMQNSVIAAESLGYGICMIGAMRNFPHEVADALGLPKHVYAVAGLCIGRPASESSLPPKPRLPLDAVLHTNSYMSEQNMLRQIDRYDQQLSEWYDRANMHADDSRWSRVMGQRVAGFKKRQPVDDLLKCQGF